VYDYVDENGKLLYQVVRWDPKHFTQRRPPRLGDDPSWIKYGWVWKAVPERELVLYRLPRVIEGIRAGVEIWVPEGEKDVHALEAAGAVATCNPGGAGKWRKQYNDLLWRVAMQAKEPGSLQWIRLVIVRDKDKPDDPKKPGQAHAQDLAVSFSEFNFHWRAVEAARGKDAADHLSPDPFSDDPGLGLEDFVPIHVPAEKPDRRNFNGYRARRRRIHEVDWSAEGPERGSREFEGWET
jgi:hypothetical protein